MSTNGMESWAVDLKDVGAIYPFQGTEVILVILGVAFWIAFHVMQARVEAGELKDAERDFNAEHSQNSIDRY
ncbi:MAG: hypothetical protein AAGA00_06895 [Pseudomonadota bacterium]